MAEEIQIVAALKAALTGNEVPMLRGLSYEYLPDEKAINIVYYVDREPSEDDFDELGEICGGFLSQFADDEFSTIQEDCVLATMPMEQLMRFENIVYTRKED